MMLVYSYNNYQTNLMSLSFGYTYSFTITREVNSGFPRQPIILSNLTLEPLCLSRCHFEFHLNCLSKECRVGRFVHNGYNIIMNAPSVLGLTMQ